MLEKKNQEFESKSDDEREIWNSIHHIAKNKNTEKHRNPLHSPKMQRISESFFSREQPKKLIGSITENAADFGKKKFTRTAKKRPMDSF